MALPLGVLQQPRSPGDEARSIEGAFSFNTNTLRANPVIAFPVKLTSKALRGRPHSSGRAVGGPLRAGTRLNLVVERLEDYFAAFSSSSRVLCRA